MAHSPSSSSGVSRRPGRRDASPGAAPRSALPPFPPTVVPAAAVRWWRETSAWSRTTRLSDHRLEQYAQEHGAVHRGARRPPRPLHSGQGAVCTLGKHAGQLELGRLWGRWLNFIAASTVCCVGSGTRPGDGGRRPQCLGAPRGEGGGGARRGAAQVGGVLLLLLLPLLLLLLVLVLVKMELMLVVMSHHVFDQGHGQYDGGGEVGGGEGAAPGGAEGAGAGQPAPFSSSPLFSSSPPLLSSHHLILSSFPPPPQVKELRRRIADRYAERLADNMTSCVTQ